MSSPAAGACVLVVLAGGALAVVFAVSPTAGVFAVWGVGGLALWRGAKSVRRAANPSPPPPADPSQNTNMQFTVIEDRPGHCTIQWHADTRG